MREYTQSICRWRKWRRNKGEFKIRETLSKRKKKRGGEETRCHRHKKGKIKEMKNGIRFV